MIYPYTAMVYYLAGGYCTIVEQTDIAMRLTLHLPFDTALTRVKDALKTQGFGVMSEIDVQEAMRQKLGVDFRRYIILGVCNPPLAHRAFHANLEAGLLLPCNVIVYEDEGAVQVAIADPLAMVRLMDHPDFRELAGEARGKLLEALRILEQRLS